MHDPELPAGFQDEDFEMREAEEVARRSRTCAHPPRFLGTYEVRDGFAVKGWRRCGECGLILSPEEVEEARNA